MAFFEFLKHRGGRPDTAGFGVGYALPDPFNDFCLGCDVKQALIRRGILD